MSGMLLGSGGGEIREKTIELVDRECFAQKVLLVTSPVCPEPSGFLAARGETLRSAQDRLGVTRRDRYSRLGHRYLLRGDPGGIRGGQNGASRREVGGQFAGHCHLGNAGQLVHEKNVSCLQDVAEGAIVERCHQFRRRWRILDLLLEFFSLRAVAHENESHTLSAHLRKASGFHNITKPLFDAHIAGVHHDDLVVGPSVRSPNGARINRWERRKVRPIANYGDALARNAEVFMNTVGKSVVNNHDSRRRSQKPSLHSEDGSRREAAPLPRLEHAEAVEVLHPDDEGRPPMGGQRPQAYER